LIIHKEGPGAELKFYFLDSSNLTFLDKSDDQIPDVMEERNRQKLNMGIPLGKNN